jgi:hypothetical protein
MAKSKQVKKKVLKSEKEILTALEIFNDPGCIPSGKREEGIFQGWKEALNWMIGKENYDGSKNDQ